MYIVLCGVGRQVEVFHQKDCFSSRRRAPGAFTVQQQEEKEEKEEKEEEEEEKNLQIAFRCIEAVPILSLDY